MNNTRIRLRTINGKRIVYSSNVDLELAFHTIDEAMRFIDVCHRAVK